MVQSIFRKFALTLVFIALSFLASCEKLADMSFSEKDDVEMGANFDKEIRSDTANFKILENEPLRLYVQGIINQILKSPAVKRKKVYNYKVTLLDGDDVINAFCTPGGYIYVYTGLLKFLENEATLAAVLGHEIAHAEKRHVRQRMISAMGIEFVLKVLLQDNSSLFKEIALGVAGMLVLLQNSRSDELEADELGFAYLKTTPYYEGSMSFFFEKIKEKEKSSRLSKALESVLSTHPIAENRLEENDKRIKAGKIKSKIPANLMERRYKNTITELLGKIEEE